MKHRLSILRFVFRFSKIPLRSQNEFLAWWRRDFASPSPQFIKMLILSKAKKANAWIETGTYMGETTATLARFGCQVISIEPNVEFARNAKLVLSKYPNVQIVEGASEDRFEEVVSRLSGEIKHLALWLDGHYSSGVTYLGAKETPIQNELEVLTNHLHEFEKVSVFIDDFRCFVDGQADYPDPNYLSKWAAENNFKWTVEHDIFFAWN